MTARRMTPARRKRILERDGHACTICTATKGPFEIDHHLPLWLGGTDADENLRTLCLNCHKGETRAGTKSRAKCKRLNGTTGQNRRKAKIHNRGFRPAPDGHAHFQPGRKIQSRKGAGA